MKQIIPFRKELLFNTKVSEVTSISLEHSLSSVSDDLVCGEFHIFGDYKITEGSINREKFSFKIPFDITMDSKYKLDTIVVDIDNFYYEVVNNDTLKVSIDFYIDGEKEDIVKKEDIVEERKDDVDEIEEDVQDNYSLDNDVDYKKVDNYSLDNDFNIFDKMDSADTYVTYYVYIVKEGDSLDSILDKYQVTRDDLALYNDIDNIKAGMKLIIPSKNG